MHIDHDRYPMSQFKDHQTFTLPGTSPATQEPQSQAKPSDSDARRNTMIPTISSTRGPLSRPGRGMSLREAGESPCPLPINEPLLMAKPNLSLTPYPHPTPIPSTTTTHLPASSLCLPYSPSPKGRKPSTSPLPTAPLIPRASKQFAPLSACPHPLLMSLALL